MKRPILIILLLITMITACSSPNSKFLGKWTLNDGSYYTTQFDSWSSGHMVSIEFLKDGKVIFNSQEATYTKTGNYSVIDESRIEIRFSINLGGDDPVIYEYKFDGKNLELYYSDKNEYAFLSK